MVELQVLNRILAAKSWQLVIFNNLDESYFPTYTEEFNFIKNHYDKYNVIPDKETFVNNFDKFDFIEVNEPDDYLIGELREQRLYLRMAPHMNNMMKLMTEGKSQEALEYWQSTTNELIKETDTKCTDLISEANIRFDNYLQRTRDFNRYYHKTGFPELDEVIGGWDAKDELALILARPNVGKTWIMIYFALQSAKQGLKVGIYSGEMSEDKIGYRLDTFLFNISNWGLTHGDINVQVDYEKGIQNIKDIVKGSVKVLTPLQLDGPATVSKLRAFIEREELDILYIDQYSLLSDEKSTRNTFDSFANISKGLKTLQVLKKIPIVVVGQLSRSENETAEGPGLKNIAGSDRIGQDATLAIFLEQKDKNLIMTIGKARDAKVGDKLTYNCDINTGRLTFIPTDTDATDGKYVDEVKEEFSGDRSDDIF